jgi:hypothetical protein
MRRFFALEHQMAGKKISRANMARIQAIADHAYAMGAKHPGMVEHVGKAEMSLSDQTVAVHRALSAMVQMQDSEYPYVEDIYDAYLIVCMGDRYYRADYSTDDSGAVTLAARDAWIEVEEIWQPVTSAAKAGLPLDVEAPEIAATMKAAGERQLEVQIAFGGPRAKDTHGEYFSARTDLAESDFPHPPLIYYHGYDQRTNKAMSKPVVIGKPLKRWTSDHAHHILYQLKSNQWADQTWADACKGEVPASPGTVGYLIRKATDGELLYWPVAEVSAWDRAGGRKQAYRHTVATAALKALYVQEGLSLPSVIKTAASETPEALGDSASVQAQAGAVDLSLDTAAPLIVSEITQALLTLRKRTS